MTEQFGAELRPRTPRPRRAGGPLLVVLIVLVIAALGLGTWWFRAARTEPAVEVSGVTPGSPLPSSAPAAARPETTGDSGQQSAGPLPAIPGVKVEAVAADWAKRWGTPPKAFAKGYDTTAKLPGTAYRARFGVLSSPDGDGTEVATLFCTVGDQQHTKDRRLIRAMVDSCLAPALRGEEKATVSTWLNAQDYSHDVFATRELPRFVVDLVSSESVFHISLVSKGRKAGPGAVPTTRTEPAG
ncbi:hypothetical protein [Micromonospora oryzae]|uniref:hypothetical protein n=1 Tax=Micromonospora sp. DSM 102119 TaxID=3111768 RepID=UPI0031E1F5D7